MLFTIVREPDGYRVKSAAIERAAEDDPFDQSGSGAALPEADGTPGRDKALRRAGAQEGDTVTSGSMRLEYQE